ncbi:MAG: hypothetical protein HY459_03935 [Parcubacteria group bacterium]|nr:hypothetical protein [Parcubacteria group bacterium]
MALATKEPTITTSTPSLSATIRRFEANVAIIETETHETLRWPREFLPQDAAIGSELRLSFSTPKTESEERVRIAKLILNVLLGSSNS